MEREQEDEKVDLGYFLKGQTNIEEVFSLIAAASGLSEKNDTSEVEQPKNQDE